MDKMESQNKEFDAVDGLSKAFRRIQLTPIVDDDYPEIRFVYEQSIKTLIEALKQNGRI